MIKNESGITMTSLVVYVITLSIIIGVIAVISSFFYENIFPSSFNTGKSYEYDKFNLYMLKYVKEGYDIVENEEESNLELAKDENVITIKFDNEKIYFNEIILCENIDEFSWCKDISENGRKILKTKLIIDGNEYSTDYIIK